MTFGQFGQCPAAPPSCPHFGWNITSMNFKFQLELPHRCFINWDVMEWISKLCTSVFSLLPSWINWTLPMFADVTRGLMLWKLRVQLILELMRTAQMFIHPPPRDSAVSCRYFHCELFSVVCVSWGDVSLLSSLMAPDGTSLVELTETKMDIWRTPQQCL